MRLGRGVVAVVVAGALTGLAWEYFQVGRHLPSPGPVHADRIVVEKSARRMTLLRGDDVLKIYDIALGPNPAGHKQRQGDGRTPEGRYAIDFKHPRSRFHLALRISYPDANDRDNAQRNGVSPGSDIMIHGAPNGLGWIGGLHRIRDWTDGCVAVTNVEIDDIWAMTEIGTPVEIKP